MDEEPESLRENACIAVPVQKALERAPGITPVKGAENTVAGKAGAQGDFSRFVVPDFPDKDNIGILAKVGAERLWKGPADVLVDSALGSIGKLIFYRILD